MVIAEIVYMVKLVPKTFQRKFRVRLKFPDYVQILSE